MEHETARRGYSDREERLAHAYLTAKETVIRSGFGCEIDWQENQTIASVTESEFLGEAAWVILSAGFRESVVRAKFPAISRAFLGWVAASVILRHRKYCRERALRIFASRRKISAILGVVETVDWAGFGEVKRLLMVDPIRFIRTLPFMGEATSYHLAKNLGVPVVKPDRHLLRVAVATGFGSPGEMCERITAVVGDKPSVVDLVIWRYATLNADYVRLFQS